MNERRRNEIMKEYGYARFWVVLLHKQWKFIVHTLGYFDCPSEPSQENRGYESQLQSIQASGLPLTEEMISLLQRNTEFGKLLDDAARLEVRIIHRYFEEHFSGLQTDSGSKVALRDIKAINHDLQKINGAIDALDSWLGKHTSSELDDEVFQDQLSFTIRIWRSPA